MSKMNKAGNVELNDLHGLIAKEMAKKIREGSATAADFAVAVKFLKDNGIQANVTPGNPLDALAGALTDNLPFAGSEGPSH